jgi:hypothetical protein
MQQTTQQFTWSRIFILHGYGNVEAGSRCLWGLPLVSATYIIHLMHRSTNGCGLGPFKCNKPRNNHLDRYVYSIGGVLIRWISAIDRSVANNNGCCFSLSHATILLRAIHFWISTINKCIMLWGCVCVINSNPPLQPQEPYTQASNWPTIRYHRIHQWKNNNKLHCRVGKETGHTFNLLDTCL